MVVGGSSGASAHEMELEVTDPLEKAIRTVGEVDNAELVVQRPLHRYR